MTTTSSPNTRPIDLTTEVGRIRALVAGHRISGVSFILKARVEVWIDEREQLRAHVAYHDDPGSPERFDRGPFMLLIDGATHEWEVVS